MFRQGRGERDTIYLKSPCYGITLGAWIENNYCQSYSDTFWGIKPKKYADRCNFSERIRGLNWWEPRPQNGLLVPPVSFIRESSLGAGGGGAWLARGKEVLNFVTLALFGIVSMMVLVMTHVVFSCKFFSGWLTTWDCRCQDSPLLYQNFQFSYVFRPLYETLWLTPAPVGPRTK